MDWLPWSSKKYDKAIRDILPFAVSDEELSALSKEQKKEFLEKYKPNKFRNPLGETSLPEVREPLFGNKVDFSIKNRFHGAPDSALLSAGIDPLKAKHWMYGTSGIDPDAISRLGVSRKLPLNVDGYGVIPMKFKDTPPRVHGPETIKVLDKYLGHARHSYDLGETHDLAGQLSNVDGAVDDYFKAHANMPSGSKQMLGDLVDAVKKEDALFGAEMKDVMRRNGMQSLAAKGGVKGGIGALGKGMKTLFSKNKKLAPIGVVAEAITKGASFRGKESWLQAAVKANADLDK